MTGEGHMQWTGVGLALGQMLGLALDPVLSLATGLTQRSLAWHTPAVHTILVSAAVILEDGKVLLSQRRSGGHLAGMWEFPGGKVESGEDPRDALQRELREELGIEATVGAIVEATFHRYEEAEKAVLLLFYEATRTADSPAPRALDVAAFKWAERGDLDPSRFPPADVEVLKKVTKRLGG